MRRALCRASGQEPPSRGKKWKSRNKEKETDSDLVESEKVEKSLDDNLRFVTQFIDKKTDIDRLMEQHFTDGNLICPKNVRRFGIVGLHTCGPLASSSLGIFLAKDGARSNIYYFISDLLYPISVYLKLVFCFGLGFLKTKMLFQVLHQSRNGLRR